MPLKTVFRLILLVLLLPYPTAMAQNVTLKNFKQEDGLPSNEVYDIFQDKNGVMWFATDRGLANYNGTQFKKFEPKDGLTDITIFDFFPQDNDQIWCTPFNGKLFYFKNGSEKFIPYRYNDVLEKFSKENSLSGSFIVSLAVDAENNLHLFTTAGYYIKIDTTGRLTIVSKFRTSDTNNRYFHSSLINKKQTIEYYSAKKSAFPAYYSERRESIKRMFSFKKDKVVYSEGSVWVFRKNGSIQKISENNYEPLEGGEYDSGHFWISYRGKGVWIYNESGTVVRKCLHGHSVSRVFKDNFNSFWFSTVDGGVFYQPQEKINRNTLKEIYIHSLTKNEEGDLFIGCYNGDIYKKSSNGELALYYRGHRNKPAIVQYYKGEKGTYFMVDYMAFTSTGKKINYPSGVLKASDDTSMPLISRFSIFDVIKNGAIQRTDTLKFRINDLTELNGKYYCASIKGLLIWHNNQLIDMKSRLLNYRFDDLDYEPERKVFYLASLGAGVVIYNPYTGKTMNIDKSKGLSDDLVTEVYVEDKNTVWACTNYGLNRITFRNDGSYKVRYITSSDGLSENQIRDIEVVNDTIYVATANGLCSISKPNFEAIFNKRKYYLRLKEIGINNIIQEAPKEKLSLSYDKNQLDFWIESVAYGRKEQIYRYKLKGLHNNWNYTSDRKINYEFIPPGDYELEVQVLEDNRLFSDEKILMPISIRSPFWTTWWFICGVFLLLGALIYLFFRIRVLTYNQDIIRELLRLWVRKIKKKEKYFVFREQGKEIRIKTNTILYVKSSGNYMDIITEEKTYVMRCKIGDFINKVPDPLEFLRVHRSYIIRIDKVEQKTKKSVFIMKIEIPVGETYLEELDKIVF